MKIDKAAATPTAASRRTGARTHAHSAAHRELPPLPLRGGPQLPARRGGGGAVGRQVRVSFA